MRREGAALRTEHERAMIELAETAKRTERENARLQVCAALGDV